MKVTPWSAILPDYCSEETVDCDDLNKRGFGKLSLPSSPEQRQAALIFRDMQELDDMIARREEAMAAELLLNNKLVMKHYADDTGKYEEMETSSTLDQIPILQP